MIKPQLRFKADEGFDFPEWETVCFGDVFKEIIERTNDIYTYPLYSLTIEDGVTPKTEQYERSYLVKKEDSYKIVPPNAFVYNPMNLRFGALAVNHEKFSVSVSGYYNVFAINDISTLKFWENYLVSKRMLNFYFSIATGSLIEKLRVHYSNFIRIEKVLPSLPEQRKIATFLSTIDEIIATTEAEVSAWEERKKGVMQKLFSQEVRFREDDGSDFPEWEDKKLGEVFVERSERSADNLDLLSVTIANGVVRQNESDKRNVSSVDKSNYKRVCVGDLAYNSMRMWQGAEGVSAYEGIVSPAYTVLVPKTQEYAYFYEYMFKRTEMLHIFQRYSQGLTSDTWNLKYPVLSHISVVVPFYSEQKKIADCLSSLDDVINQTKAELATWQEFKKGLLQQMFV
ncbi:restriction endonuclease subunit S [Mediterraneibacter glycyrrhizinilyticus]|nr:restriction endonuclease subunit S [Mediterraneibacter glycyrrhizinilyticus]MBM6855839.1 restriction endonuclease subunit S [Mediterraneibacter glycyrrhizinilyticus]